jgi:hypothetical protein
MLLLWLASVLVDWGDRSGSPASTSHLTGVENADQPLTIDDAAAS